MKHFIVTIFSLILPILLLGCAKEQTNTRAEMITSRYVTLENLEQEKKIGETYLFKNSWFQYLGRSDTGKTLWAYPHQDGIFEVFSAAKDGNMKGVFDSEFDITTGFFVKKFSIARYLNDAIEAGRDLRKKVQRLKVLRLLYDWHPWEKTPYYLAFYKKDLKKLFKKNRIISDKKTVALIEKLEKRVRGFRTEVDTLLDPDGGIPDCREYYRRMLKDGYLDFTVVGGNLNTQSWGYVDKLKEKLTGNTDLYQTQLREVIETETKILGVPIKIRIRLTGAGVRPYRIRRNVVNFIEGMEHADMLVYNGHSSYRTGLYKLYDYDKFYNKQTTKRIRKFASFNLGLDDQSAFKNKIHDIGNKSYQVFTFESCKSYEKYSFPVKHHFRQQRKFRDNWAGFMGTGDTAYFIDFVPRTYALIKDIMEQRCAQDIQLNLQGIRPLEDTPGFVMRNVFQSSLTFILPDKETEIKYLEELSKDSAHLIVAEDPSGNFYYSTGVFPQNNPGDIVQLAKIPGLKGLYGLHKDGRVFYVQSARHEGGAMNESIVSREGERFSYMLFTTADNYKSGLIYLLSKDNKIHYKTPGEPKKISSRQITTGETIKRLGRDSEFNLYVELEDGTIRIWDTDQEKFIPYLGPKSEVIFGGPHLEHGGVLKILE